MPVWVLYVSMEHTNATTDATLTEYLSAVDNTDDSIDGAAKIAHTQNGMGGWQVDDGEELDEDQTQTQQDQENMNDTKDDHTDDPRSDSMKIQMAEHFDEFEFEYREDPDTDADVVFENDRVIVVADHTGYELTEWESDFNMSHEECDAFYRWNHEVARSLTDRSWAVADPVVFDKLEM